MHMTAVQAAQVARLPSHWRRFVRTYYRLPRSVCLSFALGQRGITFVDLVKVLARRINARGALSALLGRPIKVYPAVRLRYRSNGSAPRPVVTKCWRDLQVTYLNSTFSKKYHQLMRSLHCTPRFLHQRGVPWRCLQRMRDEGHLIVREPEVVVMRDDRVDAMLRRL
jgi:hypothetical protein